MLYKATMASSRGMTAIFDEAPVTRNLFRRELGRDLQDPRSQRNIKNASRFLASDPIPTVLVEAKRSKASTRSKAAVSSSSRAKKKRSLSQAHGRKSRTK